MPAESSAAAPVSPDPLMRIGFGFAASKTLLSAVELGVFTELAARPGTLDDLTSRLGLHPRGAADFLDALVALRLLEREDGVYRNGPEAAFYLDRARPSYAGGVFEMMNARLFTAWSRLTDALRTGKPQSEEAESADLFAAMYADPDRLRTFLQGMTGVSMAPSRALADRFPWERYESFADIGCAQGGATAQIALRNEHLRGTGFDLPAVAPVFEEYVECAGLADRLRFQAGDMFAEDLPAADVLVFGHILHDWDLSARRTLLRKAHAAVPNGGAVIVYEALIDDERGAPTGLLASLNMLVVTHGGSGFTGAECLRWTRDAGFREAYVEPLGGDHAMVVGIK
ncbi:MAG: methyltransferase [Chthonomonadales bacterium]|nr:methyltransferase [Chthonomonadales bacterium]